MTVLERNESIKYIRKQLEDGYVDVGGALEENEIQIIKEAINALVIIDQIKWERNVAIGQLEELGLSLGQKIDGVYLSKEEHKNLIEYKWMYEELNT